MDEKLVKNIEKYVVIGIILVLIYVLIISPYIQFKKNEKEMIEATKRYYEINEDKMPTGRRLATVSLETLYNEKYIEKNYYVPLTKKTCSPKNSWGKISKTDGTPKYYVYLDCGIFKSNIDHTGPEIKLKGEQNMTVSRYSAFTDPGVESITDKHDGKMSVRTVKTEGEVNTNEIGKYTITYTAYDNLKNKTEITRTVKVIQTLKETVEKATKKGYYTGSDPENYISFSNNIFRIIGVEGNNIKIVANNYIGNVNYQGIDSYLRKYYKSLSPSSKKYIVKAKYCNMNMSKDKLTTTECANYTDKRDLYIYSMTDINKAKDDTGDYLIPSVIDWTANKYDDKKAYATRAFFIDKPGVYLEEDYYNLYGVRPVITIRGDSEITSGKGTQDKPYNIGDTKKAKSGELLNNRYSGEYISVDEDIYRIVEAKKDEPTKVIATFLLSKNSGDFFVTKNPQASKGYRYVPTEQGNVGYIINNRASGYISSSAFVKHTIKVPIYKNYVIYGKEVEQKEYEVKFFAPDAFDLYNTHMGEEYDYWLLNSTKKANLTYVMSELGSIYDNDMYTTSEEHGIKVCGYLRKGATIISGSGTQNDPYNIK